MIQSLSVENIALIEKLQVELGIGLNILSGETGAGKSIIIDAVSFVLGERADRSLIRYGTDFAVVEAVFSDYLTPAVKEYLDEIGIEDEEVLILNRKMTVEGKNSCRINGRVTTLSTLKGLTELLVDIHGQHEHQSLLNPNNHVGLLDGLGGEKHMKLLDRVKEAYKNYTSLKREFSLFGDEDERVRRLDILAYQIAEIEKGDVQEGEEDELLDKRKRIRNVERILEALTNAKNLLDGYDSTAVSPELKTTISTLNMISQYDNRIDGLNERLEDARAEIIDVADTVKSILDELDFDRHSADQVEERLELVRMLQRKYGGSFDALTKFYEKAVEERDRLENAGDRVAKLEGELKKAVKDLTSACEACSDSACSSADSCSVCAGASGSAGSCSASVCGSSDSAGSDAVLAGAGVCSAAGCSASPASSSTRLCGTLNSLFFERLHTRNPSSRTSRTLARMRFLPILTRIRLPTLTSLMLMVYLLFECCW